VSSSVSYQRISKRRSLLYALLASIAMAAFAASPARAQVPVQVLTSVSGSGSITGTGAACVAVDKPNGTVTSSGCAPGLTFAFPQFNVLGIMTIVATPQNNGGWNFVRWEGTAPCAPASAACTFPSCGGVFTARAVFEDHTGPVLSGLTASQAAGKDGTATVGWATNEVLKGAQCQVDGGAFVACSGTTSHTVTAAEGTHTVGVKATDISNNVGGVITTNFRIVETALVSGPAKSSNVKSPTFVFSSLAGTAFDCSLDNVALADCGAKGGDNRGTRTFSNLADGVHTFRVRAKDGPVNDPSTLVFTWTVDTLAPTAALDKDTGPGAGALQAVNTETFNFTANEPATFQCRLDNADFADCAAPITLDHLKAGQHRFEVRAIDKAGNIGPAAFRTWSVAANDDDNDGFNAQIDCNDADPSIRPGAIEILDNAVDENCDGIVGTTPPVVVSPNTKPEQILVTMAFFSTAGKKTTKFTTLQVKNVPLGATVTVTCKGKGCPSGLKGKGFTKKNAFGTVTLAKFIKKPLKAKDVITVIVSKPNAINAVKIMTVRASKKPLITTKCQPPGAKSPVAC
jgi:hypothetical protein